MNNQEEDMGQFDPVDPLEESTTSLVSSSTSAYSSFPVDVVVYVRVQVPHLTIWLAHIVGNIDSVYNLEIDWRFYNSNYITVQYYYYTILNIETKLFVETAI